MEQRLPQHPAPRAPAARHLDSCIAFEIVIFYMINSF